MTARPYRRRVTRTEAAEARTRPSDAELVQRAAQGDQRMIDWIEERLLEIPRFMGSINRRYGNAIDLHDLDDLAQETMLKAWGKLSEFRGDGSLSGWLYRFCLLDYLNGLRKRNHRPRMLRLEAARSVSVSPTAFPAEKVLALIRTLPPEQARLLELRHFEDRSFEEIAALLGIGYEAARARYYRCLRALRARMPASDAEGAR